ncbi:MAG: MgtC/SapB family protein [Tepidanaerobacter acetatoxydans]|uniref:MgtC/SapB family protein n=1 Tax=Tepidanaerobacter acetatoxydans TaxID=499229 RepID=UPI0026ED4D75|nr:MgtC/SapB family protein [Tepidanaerobacter acetatoxydans]NLU10164.1 MgtC/SapB family protein [Tepidanaerobacter acetatoxydans]
MPREEIVFRLVLAVIAGGLIGLEREVKSRPAGLRTHILVTIGSALVTLVSANGFTSGDPARIAAQVVSGIGFLGAGTIIRDGSDIRGLTTAASVWVSGCIGVAIGAGYYLGGIVTCLLVLFCLVPLQFFEKQICLGSAELLKIICNERIGLIGEIGTFLGDLGVPIKNIQISNNNSNYEDIMIELLVNLPREVTCDKIIEGLLFIDGVKSVNSTIRRQNQI